jgi:hypothetical protein
MIIYYVPGAFILFHQANIVPCDMSACVLLYARISQHPAHLILHIRYCEFLMTRRIGERLNKNYKQCQHCILIKLISLRSKSYAQYYPAGFKCVFFCPVNIFCRYLYTASET